MTKQLFAKLAIKNIRSNKQIYVPYILASIATVAMFYLMTSLVYNDFLMERSSLLPMMFMLGSVVIGVFSFIFIMYTNSFLIKRRKKEIGLYAILGMKKKHVAFVLLLESLITSLGSILIGIISGQIMGRFVFLALNYLLKFPVSMDYPFSFVVALITFAGFTVIFFVALLYNISQVTFSNPIELVKGKQSGEKEPKSSIILFLLSVILLGSGYGISLSIEDPVSAILYFFIAVLLVIAGTYLLFISGSIFILKAMKKNKKIYYRPNAFISISGMLYRMKQNAAGLANICILATMIIVAVSTTAAIYVGTEGALESRFPYDHNATVFELKDAEKMSEFENLVRTETENAGLALTDYSSYRYETLSGNLESDTFVVPGSSSGNLVPGEMMLIPQEDIERMIGAPLQIEEGEVAVYHSKGPYSASTIELAGQVHPVHQFTDSSVKNKVEEQLKVIEGNNLVETIILVTPSVEGTDSIIADYVEENPELFVFGTRAIIGWNTTGTEDDKIANSHTMDKILKEEGFSTMLDSRDANRQEWYSANGGFLFIGVFLGLLFTFGAILITYFKQVSEGYDDRDKFQIMQKVGLDKQMIEKSTRSQIIWMFFLPLLIAVMHVAFAFPIIQKMLLFFSVTDTTLVVLCIAGVVLFFSLVYWIIYRITSRVYFSIVK